jgi:glycosyltransferase domain-containing protein
MSTSDPSPVAPETGHPPTPPLLTVVIPTRDRPQNLPGQLRLFSRAPYPVIVADSSDGENAARIRAITADVAEYRRFPPELTLYDKLDQALQGIETPFVLLGADRKITFPHAIDALLADLLAHEDHVSALGYIVGFTPHPDTIDINQVIWFTPTIGDDDPLQRHYHLMQRYQSRAFGAFRLAPLRRAVALARRVEGALFQEILMMNALALQGKMARLPVILTLQSQERSFHPPKRNDPFYWFLDDIQSFAAHYARYRATLMGFISELGITPAPHTDLRQLVDTVHAVWLHRNFDDGRLNHAARLLLGDALEPIPGPDVHIAWREPGWRDVVKRGARRYVWRRTMLRAEPRDEIRISRREMQSVMEQLDIYFGA